MPQENDGNMQNVNRRDARRYEAQDDDGHIKGSHKSGNSQENMRKEREKDENDDSSLNQLDARGTMPAMKRFKIGSFNRRRVF